MLNKKNFAPWLAAMFFMFVFGYICPTWATVTRQGVQILGALIGWLIFCVSGFGLLIPSLLAVVACVLTGYYTASEVITLGIGAPTIYLIMFIFVLVWIFSESETGVFIVRWMLSRKALNGRPYLITAVFLITMMLLGSVIGSLGILMLAIVILEDIAHVADLRKDDPWLRFLLLGVVAYSGISEMLFPFKASPLMFIPIYDGALSSIGASVNTVHYMLAGILVAVFIIVFYMLAARFFFRFDFTKLKALDVSRLQSGSAGKMRKDQKVILVTIVLAFFYPVIIMLFPKESTVYQFLNSFGQVMFLAICIAFLGFLRIDGRPVTDIREAFSKGLSWDAILAGGAVMLLGSALGSDQAGFTAWMLDLVGDLFTNLHFVVVIILIVLLSCIVTQFFSNTATNMVLSSIIAPLCIVFYQRGINISIFPVLINIGSMSACLLPAGSAPSAIMLNSDFFKDEPTWPIKHGLILLGAVILALSLAGILCAVVL